MLKGRVLPPSLPPSLPPLGKEEDPSAGIVAWGGAGRKERGGGGEEWPKEVRPWLWWWL